MKSPSRQFTEFLAKYTPDIVSQTKRALPKIRALIPGSVTCRSGSTLTRSGR